MTDSKENLEAIVKHLSVPGNVVQVTNYMHSTVYDNRHVGMFRLSHEGHLQAQHGRKWLIIDGCGIRFGRKVNRTEVAA